MFRDHLVIVAEITSQREVASRFYEILPWLFCFADHNMGSALTDFGLYSIFSYAFHFMPSSPPGNPILLYYIHNSSQSTFSSRTYVMIVAQVKTFCAFCVYDIYPNFDIRAHYAFSYMLQRYYCTPLGS